MKAVELYQSIADSNEERVYEMWHASSISDCPRAHFYKRLGIKGGDNATGAKVIRWGAGHKLEEELRPHIDKVWGGTTYNVRLTSDKLGLTGEYDNLTKDGKTLIEVKSVGVRAMIKKGREFTLRDNQPYLHHEYQNHAYVVLLAERNILVENIDYVYVTLEGLLTVFHTKVDPTKLKWVENRLERLNVCWEEKRLPPCLCSEESELWGGVYQWCNYRKRNKCCEEELYDIQKSAPTN